MPGAIEPETEDEAAALRLRDLALAEYTMLKAEAHQRIRAQVTLVGFTLTAAAALSAVALSAGGFSSEESSTASEPSRVLLLLIVPLVVNGLGMYFIQHNMLRSRIGAYCRDVLWPVLGGEAGIEGFDRYLARTPASRRAFFAAVIVAANLAVFTTSDVLALLLVREVALETSTFTAGVWLLDLLFSVLLVIAAAMSSLEFGQPIDDAIIRGRPQGGSQTSEAEEPEPQAPLASADDSTAGA